VHAECILIPIYICVLGYEIHAGSRAVLCTVRGFSPASSHAAATRSAMSLRLPSVVRCAVIEMESTTHPTVAHGPCGVLMGRQRNERPCCGGGLQGSGDVSGLT
jgi:hypothetical protein